MTSISQNVDIDKLDNTKMHNKYNYMYKCKINAFNEF